jgi:hypothetical protein
MSDTVTKYGAKLRKLSELPEVKIIFPKGKGIFPKGKGIFPKQKNHLPERKRHLPEAKRRLPEAKRRLPVAKKQILILHCPVYLFYHYRTFFTIILLILQILLKIP